MTLIDLDMTYEHLIIKNEYVTEFLVVSDVNVSKVRGKRIFMTSLSRKYYWLSKIWQSHIYIGFEHERTGKSWKIE